MIEEVSLIFNIALFLFGTLLVVTAGTRLARAADKLADLTGLGEAVVGGVFLGAATSLPGLVATLTAAWEGYPQLAVSNALGGLAIQTAFIAIADLTFKKANLEHAAASLENIFQGVLLVLLLSIPLLAMSTPQLTIGHVHPASILLVIVYLFGLVLVSKVKRMPMWRPQTTAQTVADQPDRGLPMTTSELRTQTTLFIGTAIIVSIGGFLVAESGIAISSLTGLSETFVGTVFVSVASSLPELVTSLAAVRQGSPTLAVGDIIGGNSFEILFLTAADLAYAADSIYTAISDRLLFLIGLSYSLISMLLLGLLRREKYGILNIGLESFLIIAFYLSGITVMMLLEL